jgi:hypothetical protein
MKHTPGPWQTIEVGEFTSKLAVADSHGVSVLTVVDEEGTKFGAVFNEADADLIAAAPDLLAALIELRYACTDKAEAMADAAIAKALDNAQDMP